MFRNGRIPSLTQHPLYVGKVPWSKKITANRGKLWWVKDKICVTILQQHKTVWFFEFSLPLTHMVLLLNLYRWVTAAEKPRTIRNHLLQRSQIRGHTVPTHCCCARFVQDSPLLRGYFHGLTSSAFAGSAFLATAVPSDLSFGGTELADCTETEFILLLCLGYANGRLLSYHNYSFAYGR